uniref:Putative secreted protein n=1 Tax=Ixodes ricinus TaxID=34613 RepID=A0A6B0U4S4_IXORI
MVILSRLTLLFIYILVRPLVPLALRCEDCGTFKERLVPRPVCARDREIKGNLKNLASKTSSMARAINKDILSSWLGV